MLASRLTVHRQKVEQSLQKIARRVERLIEQYRSRVHRAAGSLDAVPLRLAGDYARRRDRLANLQRHADNVIANRLQRHRQLVAGQDRMLQSLAYTNVLKRGYAVVRGADDSVLSSATAVTQGMGLEIQFADGRVKAVAGEADPAGTPSPSSSLLRKKLGRGEKDGTPPSDQGTLF